MPRTSIFFLSDTRRASSPPATHAVVYGSGDTRRDSSSGDTHATDRIRPGRIDTRSTATVPPLAITHRPTHSPATSPHRRQRAPCRAEPPLPRRLHTPLAGARAAPAPSLTRTPCRGPPTHLTPCAAPGPARGGDSQHVAPAPCSVLQPAAPLAAVRPGCCAAGRLPSSQPSS